MKVKDLCALVCFAGAVYMLITQGYESQGWGWLILVGFLVL